MSATGRKGGAVRRRDDAYMTPKWCVQALLQDVPLPLGRWLEPAAGEGAIIEAVKETQWGDRIVFDAVEIRDECKESLIQHQIAQLSFGDFLVHPVITHGLQYSVAITNPPFSLALEYVIACYRIAATAVMLLPLDFLGTVKRSGFMRIRPPDVYVIPRRPSFTNGGSDSCNYGWFVWDHRPRQHGLVKVLDPRFGAPEKKARLTMTDNA